MADEIREEIMEIENKSVSPENPYPEFTYEMRSPLTSVRALSEILHDNPNIELKQRQKFLGIIIKEVERMSTLVDGVRDNGLPQKA